MGVSTLGFSSFINGTRERSAPFAGAFDLLEKEEEVGGKREERCEAFPLIVPDLKTVSYLTELLCQVGRAVSVGQFGVIRLEVGGFISLCLGDAFPLFDVLLRAVHHADDAQLDGNDAPGEHLSGVRARVHDVQLGEHCQRPVAARVHLARRLDGVRVGKVGVGRRHGENERVLTGNKSVHQFLNLRLNVRRLIAHGHLGHARQVDQRQVDHLAGEDLQTDRLTADALVLAGNLLGSSDDLLANFIKICIKLITALCVWNKI
ncbi:hypothetical protein TYRP_012302 [Tyrophagus putrescentiae]|nr:hypothetical protein TYRP_012302 [Tyrophagus putrescentiae]